VAAIPLSSLLIVGQRAARQCNAAVGFNHSNPSWAGGSAFLLKLRYLRTVFKLGYARIASSSTEALSNTHRMGESLLPVLKADYARIASSSTRALGSTRRMGERLMPVLKADYAHIASSRQLAAAVSCFAFNVLLILGAAAWCMSGYGVLAGLYIVVLAFAPTLSLLNIGLLPLTGQAFSRGLGFRHNGLGGTFSDVRPTEPPPTMKRVSGFSQSRSLPPLCLGCANGQGVLLTR
jgi:hypothetical protein